MALVASLIVTSHSGAQQPGERPGRSNGTELGWIVVTGNASAATIGVRNLYRQNWTSGDLSWESGWVSATSGAGSRFAVERSAGFEIVEPDTATTSQRLFTKLKYARRLSPRTDWFASLDAVRDKPSNINRQFVVAAGFGALWSVPDRMTFRTSYGLGYTDEDLAIEGANRFAVYRVFYGFHRALSPTSSFQSELTADGSVRTAKDVRADWLNAISVAINARMALKSSARVLFRNLPASESIPLVTPAGDRLGAVTVSKRRVDLNVTTSLAITF